MKIATAIASAGTAFLLCHPLSDAQPVQPRSAPSAQPGPVTQSNAAFVMQAAQSGIGEVRAARLARQRSQDEDVRSFATAHGSPTTRSSTSDSGNWPGSSEYRPPTRPFGSTASRSTG